MRIRKTIFGRSKIKPNTFIGGVSATLNTPGLLATTLGINVSKIKAFSIVGDNIQCTIVGKYSMKNNAFYQNKNITYFNDPEGLVEYLNQGCFSGVTKITSLVFPGLIATLAEIDRYSSINNYDFPNCLSLANSTWHNTNNNKTITVNIPKCTSIGSSLEDNGVFCKWQRTVKWIITAHASMQTINAGSPDGDLIGLNPGSTVTYV